VKNTEGIIVGISKLRRRTRWGRLGVARLSTVRLQRRLYQSRVRLGTGPDEGLPTFVGGNNGFATGANNLGQAVGWAENDVHDPTCVSPQVLQFRPAMWGLGPPDQIHELPLISGDTSGAATAINDNGQIVAFPASAIRPLEDILPGTPCFGKTAE